ncbi:Ser/Thr protein kinase RdoA (MazF antagonist) [Actinoalloteichus hoggarensis]|uniref:Phosphotransferase enzyme family protein n=1 Tax=Actinoalloteichus hoggarensis TaxID=1470176 RepID=A0A221W5M4_9PSEU|nr:phosphotransferase [Actinoalloteichus hoggarensis]ASO21190.1 Phosphotransferase enzyme family protein [Actinoalloteichus hoggarensis]MBB5921120.1 Ser/Thr protein kinase RdoA (MazF antagonist) [Actinoalloteichus hoggarensis]
MVEDRSAAAVAAAFGLGTVLDEWESVHGGRSHRSWRLRTSEGDWIVKRLNRSRESWWLADHTIAAEIELAAVRRGISMPRPVPPRDPVAPLLADLTIDGGPASFLVHEWCSGRAPTAADITPDLADWVGWTLADLHSLSPDVPVDAVPPQTVHSVGEWAAWLDGAAPDVAPGFLGSVRTRLPDVERAVEIVTAALTGPGRGLTPVRTHRDVKPDNVLLTRTAPILVDWDGAGPDVAEWEAVRAASAFGRAAASPAAAAVSPSSSASPTATAPGPATGGGRPPGLPPANPPAASRAAAGDRHVFGRVLRAYTARSGRRIAPTTDAFAGLLRTQLGGAAWMLFRALGHRPVTPLERAAAHDHALELLADLHVSLTEIPTWTRWLAEAQDAP